MANAGWGSGGRDAIHPHQLGVWENAVSSLSGVQVEAPAKIDIHYIQSSGQFLKI